VGAVLHRAAPLLQAGAAIALAHLPAARALVPGLGVLTGPLGLVLLLVAAAVALGRALPRPVRLPPLPAWALFACAALVASAIGLRYARAVEPSGDEIDYLLMAQSVWREGDLDLRDNFARGDHLEYLGGFDRMPGGTRRADGRSYPTHSAGLSVLLAPAYALGGRAACVVLLALLAAGLGLLARDLARRGGAGEEAALLAGAAAVGPPVLFYTAFLYTEVPAAFAIALALRLLLVSPGPRAAAAAALALSALPWLHVRMTLAAAALGAFAAVRLRGRARGAFLLTAAAMAAAYAGYQYSVFGTLSPFARYAGAMPIAMERRTPLRTLVGLFVDGAYGLLPYAPVFLLALNGSGPVSDALDRMPIWFSNGLVIAGGLFQLQDGVFLQFLLDFLLQRHDVPAKALPVIGTHPVEALLAEAAAMPAGMLVMGAYEHMGLRALFTGSATKHLLRRAPCAIFAAH